MRYTTSAYSAVLESTGWFGDFPSSSDLHFFRNEVSTLLVVISVLLETPFRWSVYSAASFPLLHLLSSSLSSSRLAISSLTTFCSLLVSLFSVQGGVLQKCLGLCVRARWFFNTRLDDGRKDSRVERKMQKIFLDYSKESSRDQPLCKAMGPHGVSGDV